MCDKVKTLFLYVVYHMSIIVWSMSSIHINNRAMWKVKKIARNLINSQRMYCPPSFKVKI